VMGVLGDYVPPDALLRPAFLRAIPPRD
jgi:hypothetical protein